MKIKKLIALVSMLAVMFSLAGCDENLDKPFEYDENEIAAHAMNSFMTYEGISDDYVQYYLSDGTEYEKSVVKGITQAKETDKVGEYEDLSGTISDLSNGVISAENAEVKFEHGVDYVTVIFINNASNRDVEVSVKYIENGEYYIQYNEILIQNGMENFESYKENAQLISQTYGVSIDDICIQAGVSSLEELYEYDLNSVHASLAANGIYPYVEQEMVVSAIYSNKELVGQAGMNTLIGMGTVFVVLIFISFIISLFKYLPALFAKKPKVEPEKKSESSKATPAPVAVSENLVDDSQLVAVITAAIYAYEAQSGNGAISKDRLVVRSIKKARK